MTTSRRMTWSSRRPTKRKALEKRLDKLSSELCRLNHFETCHSCGQQGTDTHHIISRNHKRQRWNQYNLVYLCRTCHQLAHNDNLIFNGKLDQTVKIWSLPELQELEKSLKEQIKELR